MKTRAPAEMRELDRRAIQEFGIPGIVLMEHAGAAVAHYAEKLARKFSFPDFRILAGKGNNGGDALIAARLLSAKYPVRIHLTCDSSALTGDAAEAWNRLPEFLKQQTSFTFTSADYSPESVLIDGLLGTGLQGMPKAPASDWIRIANDSGQPILAIDLPSGLNGLTGEAELCIQADCTVTLAAYKTGLFLAKGPESCGRVVLAEIGFPKQLLEEPVSDGLSIFTAADFRRIFQKDSFRTYKNKKGHLLVLGGSVDYSGAPFLAAESALRGGAGLVTALIPSGAAVRRCPNAVILRTVPGDVFTEAALPTVHSLLDRMDAVVFGPGVTTAPGCRAVLDAVIASGRPAVLDADALNLLAQSPRTLRPDIILTPHAGEAARLQDALHLPKTGTRMEQAAALAKALNCVIVWKGPHTVVAEPDGIWTLNTSGNAALATAGSGDVLSGLCGAFLANHYTAADAARMAVCLHGLAADRLCETGTRGLIADDLSSAFCDIGNNRFY